MTIQTGLDFRFEWEALNESVGNDELRVTLARLELWVGDQCITLAEDADSGSSRRSIYVSLYPLAEWIAFNWWLLLANGRPAWHRRIASRPSLEPTSLRSIGDGFAWPNLSLIAQHETTLLHWTPWAEHTSPYPLRFLGRGEVSLPTRSIERSLSGFVELVIGRLRDFNVPGTPLEKEWTAVRALDYEEAEFCRASAQLGLDPFSDGLAVADALEEVFAQLEPGLREEFLDSVNPTFIESSLTWIRKASVMAPTLSATQQSLQFSELRSIVQSWATSAPEFLRAPWAHGYDSARRLRSAWGMTPSQPLQLDAAVEVVAMPIEDRSLVALGVGGDAPRVVLGHSGRETTNRFVIARSIWGFLARDRDRFLLTASSSSEQQASRAFAAELLAPATGIQELLGGATVDTSDESVLDVSEHFGVSGLLVRHQLDNQVLAEQ